MSKNKIKIQLKDLNQISISQNRSECENNIPTVSNHSECSQRSHSEKPKISIAKKPVGIKKNNIQGLIDLRDYHNKLQIKNDKPNKTLIIDVMNNLVDYTEEIIKNTSGDEKKKNQFRVTQFRKAIVSLKTYPYDIVSGQEAKKLDNIGTGIADRIDEILKTGTLSELVEKTTVDLNVQIINQLTTVTGIGEANAKKFIEMGVVSVDDLQNKANQGTIKITHHMQVGLKYYKDLQIKIPFDEVAELSQTMKSCILKIHPNVLIEVCGSHRREKIMSGDIDVLITNPNIRSDDDLIKSKIHYLKDIVKELREIGFIIDDLTSQGDTKYMGVCMHPKVKIGRRIDIRFVTYESYPCALLYFTGSMMTNKLMRTIALEKGYTLNEYGLYHFVNMVKGNKIIVNSEKDIFDKLGIVYLEPNEREI